MALFASQITLSRDRHHTFRKTAITWRPDRLQTPSLCVFTHRYSNNYDLRNRRMHAFTQWFLKESTNSGPQRL